MVKQRAGFKVAKFESVKVREGGDIARKSCEAQSFEPGVSYGVDEASWLGRRLYSAPSPCKIDGRRNRKGEGRVLKLCIVS